MGGLLFQRSYVVLLQVGERVGEVDCKVKIKKNNVNNVKVCSSFGVVII